VVASTIVAAFIVAYNIVQLSYRQTICPDHLLGRMNATMRFVMWGITPVGGVLGGVLGTAVGPRNTLWITAVGLLLPVLWLIFSPLGPAAWAGKPLPQEPPPAGPGSAAGGTGTELEKFGGLGQRAGGDQSKEVGAGPRPVDGAGLGQALAAAVEHGEYRPGIPGQRDDVDVAAGGAKRLADRGGVLVDSGHQTGVAQGGDDAVDTDTGHELVEDGVGGDNPS
jgi:hypothetical protein